MSGSGSRAATSPDPTSPALRAGLLASGPAAARDPDPDIGLAQCPTGLLGHVLERRWFAVVRVRPAGPAALFEELPCGPQLRPDPLVVRAAREAVGAHGEREDGLVHRGLRDEPRRQVRGRNAQ